MEQEEEATDQDMDSRVNRLLGFDAEAEPEQPETIDPGPEAGPRPGLGTYSKIFNKVTKGLDVKPMGVQEVEEDPNVGFIGNVGRDVLKGVSNTAGTVSFLTKHAGSALGVKEMEEWGRVSENFYADWSVALTEEQDPEYLKERRKKFVEGLEEEREPWSLREAGQIMANPFQAVDRYVEFGDAWTSPEAISGMVAESSFPSLVGMTTGYGYTRFLSAALKLSPKLAGVIGMGLGESQMYAASSAQQVYNAIEQTPTEALQESPEYLALLETVPGESPEEVAINARNELAAELAWKSAAKTGALVWAMHIPVGSYVGRLLGGAPQTVSRSAFKTTFLSSAVELPKSAGDKYFRNMAAIRSYDPERSRWEGVAEAGVSGAVAVGPMGAFTGVTMNMLGRRNRATPPGADEIGGVEVSGQNIRDALRNPDMFEGWRQKLVEATGKEISAEDFTSILESELQRFDAASSQDAEKRGITNRKDKGKSFRKFRRPKAEMEAEGREARTRLTDAYQRTEGDMGLASEHVLAQYNLDLYNRLKTLTESPFEKMAREAKMKEMREAKKIKEAEEILARRGQSLRPPQETVEDITSQETQDETRDALDKIRPKVEMPERAEDIRDVTPRKEAAPAKAAPAENDILTARGKSFKSQAGAKSKRTRQGLQDTHDVVEVEGGYALRPTKQAEAQAVAEPAESETRQEQSVFEDLELLLEEKAKVEAGESEMKLDELDPILASVQDGVIQYMEELDPSLRSAFVMTNFELTPRETEHLGNLLNKEATEGISSEDNATKNALVRKMVGKPQITKETLENKGKEPVQEEDELVNTSPKFFDSDPESVAAIKQAFESKSQEQIRENPDNMLGYLVNQVNAWIHGVGEADVSKIRETLEYVRSEQQRFYDYFGNQVHLNDFIESVDEAIELTDRANELKSKGSNPNTLRVSFGMEAFYPVARDTIARIKNWKGKMDARSALNKLKKNLSDADMEYLRIDQVLNQAAREGRKVTKEDVLDGMAQLPEINVEIRTSAGAAPQAALKLLYHIDPSDLKTEGGKGAVSAISKTLEISEEAIQQQVAGSLTLGELLDMVPRHIDMRETVGPAFRAYSHFASEYNILNDPYEYEEMLITLPEYAHSPADARHAAFGKPVAFFARVSRNQDTFVVEEIQSELASIKAEMNKDIPSPYKNKAWPNIIAAMLTKRARELGYKEIHMPSYDWVNKRWDGHLPRSTQPLYDKVLPRAMEEAGAKRQADAVIEDARLAVDPDILVLVRERIPPVATEARRVGEIFNNRKENATKLIDKYLSTMNEIFRQRVMGFGMDRDSVARDYLQEYVKNANVGEATVSWTQLAKISLGVASQVELGVSGAEFRDHSNLNHLVDLGRMSEAVELTMKHREISESVVADYTASVEDLVNGKITKDAFIESTSDTLTKVPDIPFQRYSLPRQDPEPGSIPVTLNMGFDPTNVTRLAKRAAGKLTNQAKRPNPNADGSSVARMYENTRKESEKAFSAQTEEVKNLLRTKLVDVTSPMKKMITNTFGEQKSNQMISRIVLAKGHSVRANMFLNRAMKDIYGRLGRKKRRILNEIIFSSRIIQIARYKGNITDFKGRSPQQHRDFLNNIEEVHGLAESEALDLFRRAEKYFDKTLELLDVLREDGLISEDEYNELKTFRWTRTEALKKIDPDVPSGILSPSQSVAQRRQAAKTKESGIEELELGSELDTPNIDMQYVLADWTQRVMKRSALAKMNKSLWDLAQSEQKNELVRPAKGQSRPADWSAADILVRGERKRVYIHPQFARYWTMEMTEISPFFANVARIVSGSVILRPMATGIRIGFIPINIVRDIVLQQYSAKYLDNGKWKPVWNKWLPIGVSQQLFEIGRMAPAALFRTKRYQKFVEAGGSMMFMTVQGKPFQAADIKTRFGRGPAAWTAQTGHAMDSVMDVLSHLNSTSEIITRLSLVEKALYRIAQREGISKKQARNDKAMYEEAVAVSRDYLDFGQSGSLVKAIDTFRPYTGAAVQAGRSMLRSWKKDWKHAALQSAQVAGLGALLSLGRAGYMQEEDEDGITRPIERDISARDQARFFITFPFGRQFYFTDEYGNRHRPYVKIPVDGLLIPPKILGEVAASVMTGQEIRGDVIREGMRATVEPYGVGGGLGIPSLDAYFTMAHNLDTYFGGRVWPHEEYMEASKRVTEDTPQFFKDISEFINTMPGVNMSPEQFYQAARGIGAGGTWFTHYFGQMYDYLRDVPEPDREVSWWEAVADHPTTGSMISYTRPDIAAYEQFEEWETETITKQAEKRLKVLRDSKRIREILGGELESGVKTTRLKRKLSDYIEANAEDEKERERLYEIIEFYTEMPGSPRFGQWQRLAGKTPETKARYLKQMLEHAGPVEREKIWNEAKMFPHADSAAVWREFDRLAEQRMFRE